MIDLNRFIQVLIIITDKLVDKYHDFDIMIKTILQNNFKNYLFSALCMKNEFKMKVLK